MTISYVRPHFDVVKDIARKILDEKKIFAWFVTLKGTTHHSVTEAPLIEPLLLSWATGSTIDVNEGIYQYVKATADFMEYLKDGYGRGILSEEVTHPGYKDSRDEARKRACPRTSANTGRFTSRRAQATHTLRFAEWTMTMLLAHRGVEATKEIREDVLEFGHIGMPLAWRFGYDVHAWPMKPREQCEPPRIVQPPVSQLHALP
ncbi:hypothetical protein LTR56_015459 [Elasticomyces elasticus]|nr:hypothetical protein LTR22_022644 [Elasticomyces elasticus]KAK3634113.1 hypothetical protein LTR56_015459 [Elasticomyces elasticus]KAK4909967.1 hypothetical protein LTR49_021309 [Elasticomyces elasticus]KAK5754885.1 hypothetical protein LTS12_015008 [Elasticomyces elasticus]